MWQRCSLSSASSRSDQVVKCRSSTSSSKYLNAVLAHYSPHFLQWTNEDAALVSSCPIPFSILIHIRIEHSRSTPSSLQLKCKTATLLRKPIQENVAGKKQHKIRNSKNVVDLQWICFQAMTLQSLPSLRRRYLQR
jgi:hypothetical protein